MPNLYSAYTFEVALVFFCSQEVGFSFVELNASDTRSKKSLQQEVAEALNNHTLVDFFGKVYDTKVLLL